MEKSLSRIFSYFYQKEKDIKIGDFVTWETEVIMWRGRQVVHIEKGYAFVDGSMTGIPINQLRLDKP